MPNLRPGDPKSLKSLVETYGTRDTGIDPDEIEELLEQADEEIREAEYDLAGGFPAGGLKSAEMATLKMGLALALGYCRRLAVLDAGDPLKGQRSHYHAALLLWFWARDDMPRVAPVAAQLVEVIQRRNDYGYRGYVISASEARDITESVKDVRFALGDAPVKVYQSLMAQLRDAQREIGR